MVRVNVCLPITLNWFGDKNAKLVETKGTKFYTTVGTTLEVSFPLLKLLNHETMSRLCPGGGLTTSDLRG